MPARSIRSISFGRVYPLYVDKAERKGRTKAEVDEIIRWLTGYEQDQLQAQVEKGPDFETFFAEAPELNPARGLILRGQAAAADSSRGSRKSPRRPK